MHIAFEDIETLPAQIVRYYARILEEKIQGEGNGNEKGGIRGNYGKEQEKEEEGKRLEQVLHEQPPVINVIEPEESKMKKN